ncbi:MAG: IS110 family transposase [Desulfobacterales bacterium]|nr:MAG: IS110 family transposase [Desulfobacterales bacterium]
MAKQASKKRDRKIRQLNPNAAGIDIGSQTHYVAVPSDRDNEPVRSFGCLTPDLHQMARWLKSCRIETIAMESTGVYWVPVVAVLESYGFDVKLVDAYKVKNVPGRKTDVKDCQWLAELHRFGLLSGAFRPDKQIQVLRSYWRHRSVLVEACSTQIHLMQKALEQMNIQLHKVITDITGVTGMKIIRAIVAGERDAVKLAGMKHALIKSSTETIAKALTGEYRQEHLFTLKQALEIYDVYQNKIADCDHQIEEYMKTFEQKADANDLDSKSGKNNRTKRRKNQPNFDLRTRLFEMTGVDLTQIDGIETMTAQTVISECGFDMSVFPTEKHFTSWLGLCPNNQITGGKVRKHSTRKVQNRAARALRLAAQSLHSSKSALGAFYRRMRARLGAPKAITATAHKLAKLVYRMLKYGTDYVDSGQQYYENQYRKRVIKNLTKRAREMGYVVVCTNTGELVS